MTKVEADGFAPETDFLRVHAVVQPEKAALIAAGTAPVTFRMLDVAADRLAQRLQSLGINAGATIGLLLGNSDLAPTAWWAARRAGLYYVPISTRLAPSEIAFILEDSGAVALLSEPAFAGTVSAVRAIFAPGQGPRFWLSPDAGDDGPIDPLGPTKSPAPMIKQAAVCGREIIYSSGTAGMPKGIRRDLQPANCARAVHPFETALRKACAFSPDMTYLSVSPLYHATGRFVMRVIEEGGTSVILPRFDPLASLAAIERHRVTHSQWVPTMFVRLLALAEADRRRHDLSSLRMALHAAAPCPPDVKRAMIDWFGPVVCEYYGGSENAGVTFIDTVDWLDHPGSVGRSITGPVHIVDENDNSRELGAGEIGLICFEGGVMFRFTNGAEVDHGFGKADLATYGDLGHIDGDGFLYISDRRSDLIIRGGVNIYPREVELVLEDHPSIAEVAVIGVADREFGQRIHAVAVLRQDYAGDTVLEEQLHNFCRSRLAGMKCPEQFHFVDSLPRNENGKLLKRILRTTYERHAQ